MQKIYSCLLFTALSCVTVQTSSAQVWMGLYGVRSNTTGSFVPDVGGGFGMSFMSDPSAFGAKPAGTSTAVVSNSPIKVQFGMNMYWSGLGHRTFNNVPLAMSQLGSAKVNLQNYFFGINVMSRLSLPTRSIFTPYGEAYLGYRGTFSNMNVDPYVKQPGTSQTDHSIATVNGLNYGLGGGLTVDLTKNKLIKLDLGVSYIEQIGRGNYVDLHSATADGGGVNLNMKPAPNGILMMNVGLLFYIQDDGDDDDCDCKCKCKHHHHSNSRTGYSGGWGRSGGSGYSNVNVHFGGGGSVISK